MDADELALFTGGIADAAVSSGGAALDTALRELGWLDALAVDPSTAVPVLFEHQGRANTTSSALDRVLARGLGLPVERACALVLPCLRATDPPGSRHGMRWSVDGVALGAVASHDEAVVVAGPDAGPARALLCVPVGELEVRRVGGLDPTLGLVEVRADLELDAPGRLGSEPVSWEEALALGQLAVGYEQLGAARAMIDLARQHALDRVQFGRPIASFQAVRHRLADALVSLEAADALLGAAWENPVVFAAMAKAFAGSSARTVARHCQQVLAGIGFTTEHPFHRLVRRTIVLDQLLGDGKGLTRRLGTQILDAGVLPRTFAL
jgi:Acyl-CoA dehydrogenase, C-terminal domain